MLEEKIHKRLLQYSPPLAVSFVLGLIVYDFPSQTLLNWPILGEFVIDDILKVLIFAIVWFFVFIGWGHWLKHSSSNYSDMVREATGRVREVVFNFSLDFNRLHDDDKKTEYLEQIKGELSDMQLRLQSSEVQLLATQIIINKSLGHKHDEKMNRFIKLTNWVKKR